jgi:hypothetical protein
MTAAGIGELSQSTQTGLSSFSKPASRPNPVFLEREDYKAAVGDLNQTATLRHSRFEMYGCCITAS